LLAEEGIWLDRSAFALVTACLWAESANYRRDEHVVMRSCTSQARRPSAPSVLPVLGACRLRSGVLLCFASPSRCAARLWTPSSAVAAV